MILMAYSASLTYWPLGFSMVPAGWVGVFLMTFAGYDPDADFAALEARLRDGEPFALAES